MVGFWRRSTVCTLALALLSSCNAESRPLELQEAVAEPINFHIHTIAGGNPAAMLPEVPLIPEDPCADVIRPKHPYAVSLRYTGGGQQHYCGGVLVGKKHVLTAAHCVDRSSLEPKPKVVVGSAYGSRDSGCGSQHFSTSKVTFHPESRDLAILELSGIASEDPISLPSSSLSLKHNDPLSVMGWGRNAKVSANTDLLQVAEVKVMARNFCKTFKSWVKPYHLCVRGSGSGSCNGDDGGPVVRLGDEHNTKDDVLVGIVGKTHSCGSLSALDVDIRIDPYLDWIKETIG